jgi:hypothetical protein
MKKTITITDIQPEGVTATPAFQAQFESDEPNINIASAVIDALQALPKPKVKRGPRKNKATPAPAS